MDQPRVNYGSTMDQLRVRGSLFRNFLGIGGGEGIGRNKDTTNCFDMQVLGKVRFGSAQRTLNSAPLSEL